MHRRNVDFPPPEGPIITTTSPRRISVDMPSSTLSAPKLFWSPSILSNVSSIINYGRVWSRRGTFEQLLDIFFVVNHCNRLLADFKLLHIIPFHNHAPQQLARRPRRSSGSGSSSWSWRMVGAGIRACIAFLKIDDF